MLRIKWFSELENDQIYLSNRFVSECKLNEPIRKLHFGSWNREVKIIMCNQLSDCVIGLPERWKEDFVIPDHVMYDYYIQEFDLYMGPLVAIIAFSKHSEITKNKLNDHRDYFLQFGNGLLFICAADGIDMRKKVIKGYYYAAEALEDQWKSVIVPYPGAAYNRAKMSEAVFDDIVSVTNHRIFNSYSNGSFNKWELWKRLSPERELKPHLPQTKLLTGRRILNKMLNRYGSVYLKPSGGTLSRGIMKVYRRKEGDGYLIYFPNRKRKGKGKFRKILVNHKQINRWLRRLKHKKYIVQEAVSMKMYNRMPIDFRIIMQKTKHNKWECTGIFSKYGKKGSIITNFSRAGFLLSGIDSFRLAFQMDDEQAQNKINELISIAQLICATFDKYGHYGDVGIDLIVDENEKVWILEVNTLDTYHRFPLHLNNRKLYEKVVANPLEYAKALTGFNRYGENSDSERRKV